MPKSRTESVDEWEQILTALVEDGKVHLTPEETVRGEAWRLAQQEEELAQLRALASEYGVRLAPQEPVCDPETILHLIDEARGIHGAAQALAALPHVQRHEFIVTQLQCVAQAAQAILDGLVKLR